MTKICTTMDQSLLDEVEDLVRGTAVDSRAAVIRQALRLYLDVWKDIGEIDEINPGGYSLVDVLRLALEHWIKRERAYQAAAKRLGKPREEVTYQDLFALQVQDNVGHALDWNQGLPWAG